MELSLSKYYLGRILANQIEKGESIKQSASNPLSLYNQQFRALIGKVLIHSTNLGSLGPYIPLFYWDGVINAQKIFPKVRIKLGDRGGAHYFVVNLLLIIVGERSEPHTCDAN